MTQERIVNKNVNPLLRSLPGWMTGFRPHQVEAIEQIMNAYDRGVKVVVLDAPTGSGKTLIGESVRRLLKSKASYVCSSKSLQDQFMGDYAYARVLKGRANYPTERFPEMFGVDEWRDRITCEDCNWDAESGCQFCRTKASCPYEVAKWEALRAEVAVLNTSYWLAEVDHVGKFSAWDKKEEKTTGGFVVVDEADTLEAALMGYVTFEISERRMRRYGLEPPETLSKVDSWRDWIDDTRPRLIKFASAIPDHGNIAEQRELRMLGRDIEGLQLIRRGLDEPDHAWVYTGQGRSGRGRADKNVGLAVSFKPSRVDQFGDRQIWRHAERFLLMSATVISSQEMLESLGYVGSWETVKVRNTFPVKNRRVVVMGKVAMSAKAGEEAKTEMKWAVGEVVRSHPNERVLIHTVSYDLARLIEGSLRADKESTREIVGYSDAGGRGAALARYLATPAAVLIAPSMDRGIDLPGDACRVQIIAKVPFPYLGDKQISARLYGSRNGQTWYLVQTIRTVVQMCGRAVRSEEDYAITYVLDRQFGDRLWLSGRSLFPEWFREAIDWRREKEGK